MELIAAKGISIRTMEDTERDYEILYKWLSTPEIKKWYETLEGLTPDAIKNKYKPRIMGEHHVHPCIIEYGKIPVGYVQFYETKSEPDFYIQEDFTKEPNVYALDIFIGEPSQHGKGIGSESLRLIVQHLVRNGAKKVIIDPDIDNERAIRAYEKAGFTKIKMIEDLPNNKKSWLMLIESSS